MYVPKGTISNSDQSKYFFHIVKLWNSEKTSDQKDKNGESASRCKMQKCSNFEQRAKIFFLFVSKKQRLISQSYSIRSLFILVICQVGLLYFLFVNRQINPITLSVIIFFIPMMLMSWSSIIIIMLYYHKSGFMSWI